MNFFQLWSCAVDHPESNLIDKLVDANYIRGNTYA